MNKLFIVSYLFLTLSLAFAAEKVLLQFYYESLCPGCFQFLKGTLKKALYTEGLETIFDLKLYPYGNAHQRKGAGGLWDFSCQHGPKECYGNLIESCILGIYHPNNSNKAVICIEEEEHQSGNFDSALSICAPTFQLDLERVQKCLKEKEGNEFQHQIADETESLNPPHKWVPWLVVDGKYNKKDADALERNPIKFICDRYKGRDKPSACSQHLEEYPFPFKQAKHYCYKQNFDKSVFN